MTKKNLNNFSKISPYLTSLRQKVLKSVTSALESFSQKLSSNQTNSKLMSTVRSPLLKTLESAVSSLQKLQPQLPVIESAPLPIINTNQPDEPKVVEANEALPLATVEIKPTEAIAPLLEQPQVVVVNTTPLEIATATEIKPEINASETSPTVPQKVVASNKPPATSPLKDKVKAATQNQAKGQVQPPLKDRVQAELSEAFNFVTTKLVPVVVSFVTVVVEKIDPPLSLALAKFMAIPAIAKGWQNFQTTGFFKRFSTATAPIWRSVRQTLAPVPVPASLKPILTKPTGAIAFVLVLTLIISLKPHPSAIVKAPIPNAIAQPQVNPINKLVPPEKSDISVSPEKVLVAAIQEQVTSISTKYGEALIGSVQTNFKLGRLIVQLTDAWYQLAPERQQELVNEIQQRSQALTFKKLLIADSANNLLARSPAIGTDMVILRQ